ncbi:MAG: pantoate--beta-alanine ligase [Deltaproteobacteria bacterium]|nr:pantoate--beta-alanine ligase [Deltaproteobacteria bacterium]
MSQTIRVLDSIPAVRAEVSGLKRQGKRIGLVPTMGYLHEAHLSLVTLVKQHCDVVLATIFVNPAQFNDPSDLEKYPRDIPRDLRMLESVGTHGVFIPTPSMMYGPAFESWVELSAMPLRHEGQHRPGHFRGVSTVVSMLFNVTQPDVAIFGEKDFQQLRILERMVDDLKFPIQVLRGPLVREPDGLAMSSRNVRLDAESRKKALSISRGLFEARAAFLGGERRADALRGFVVASLQAEGLSAEYIEVVEEDTLEPKTTVDQNCRILVAVPVGPVRLIDNIALRATAVTA